MGLESVASPKGGYLDAARSDNEMRFNSWSLGALRVIDLTGEGREIMVGQRAIRTIVRASLLLGPGDKIVSLRIEPLALIITGPDEQYALCMDGSPADLPSLLEMIS